MNKIFELIKKIFRGIKFLFSMTGLFFQIIKYFFIEDDNVKNDKQMEKEIKELLKEKQKNKIYGTEYYKSGKKT